MCFIMLESFPTKRVLILHFTVLGKVINYQEKLYIMRHKVEYKFSKKLNYVEKSIYPKCI